MRSLLTEAYVRASQQADSGIPAPVSGPLAGILVVGLVEHLAGPIALGTLVSYGAIGIGIEPLHGDPARKYLSSETFNTFNAGRLSIKMNLKTDPDYLALLQNAHVILDNRSKRARDQDAVLQRFLQDTHKPRQIIYCCISGFPGESESQAGNDVTVQAATGVAYINGPGADNPLKVGFPVLDFVAADWAVIAIISRLMQLMRHLPIDDERNKVIPIKITLAAVAARLICSAYLDAQAGRPVRQRIGNQDSYVVVFSFFKASDGLLLAIATLTDESFKKFCEQVIHRPDFAIAYPTNALRLAAKEKLTKEIQTIIETQPRAYWLEKLSQVGITCAEVNSVEMAVKKPFSQSLFARTKNGISMIARADGTAQALDEAPTLDQHGVMLRRLLRSRL